ncbi:ComEC family protein [Siccibacter turicensis]|uniref:ComEC family protein n=1 Tax=Siccibacter turicensis TaxID=357233 RepID=UPI003F542EC0
MTLPALALCAIVGMLPLRVLPMLPPGEWIAGGALMAFLLLLRGPQAMRYGCVTVLCLCWGLAMAHFTLAPIADLTGRHQSVEAVVRATDGATTHTVTIVNAEGKWLPGGVNVTLYGSYLPAAPCPGQRWSLLLALRPVHGQLNEGGFDNQRHSLSQGKVLTGRVLRATILNKQCSLRGKYIASVTRSLNRYAWRDVILALGFGERLNVSDSIKNLMRATGTAHLMAISGLHIALAGAIGWGMARLMQRFLPAQRIGYRLPLLLSLLVAAVYTWLAGANPPAVRTLLSLTICAATVLSGRRWHPWQIWLCCIGSIVIADPLAVLSDSLWLSAFAVAALIFWYQWMPFRPHTPCRPLRMLYGMVHLQAGITLLLLPLQISLFHGISTTSLVANMFAVPAITLISVPLILAGMVLHLLPLSGIEQAIWWLADRSLAVTFSTLEALPDGWLEVDQRWQWLALVPWLAIACWRLRLHVVVPFTAATMLASTLFPFLPRPAEKGWAVHMLDVGHGLALVIERHGRAMLYDTGGAWPGGDSGRQTIIPWLRWHHLTPEGVIVSHEHLDHRGGLASVLAAWPGLPVRSPMGWEGHSPCERGQTWRWQGLRFTALWPLPGHKQSGNNRSCVVRIDDGHQSIVLTGDIEADAELAMLKHHWQFMRADVIQVPHHGSRTSSGGALLGQVAGRVAIASVARYNAWHLPSKKVVERYRTRGYRWFDTAHAGQISVVFTAHGWHVRRYREQILPRWYHQWFGVPADSR